MDYELNISQKSGDVFNEAVTSKSDITPSVKKQFQVNKKLQEKLPSMGKFLVSFL